MFPQVDIVRWRAVAPWADDDNVEQDLVITLALFDIFRDQWPRPVSRTSGLNSPVVAAAQPRAFASTLGSGQTLDGPVPHGPPGGLARQPDPHPKGRALLVLLGGCGGPTRQQPPGFLPPTTVETADGPAARTPQERRPVRELPRARCARRPGDR